MKRVISTIMLIGTAIIIAFVIFYVKGERIAYVESEYNNELILKGVEKANALALDEKNNIYVAINNKVLIFDSNRQKKILFEEKDSDIYDIEYFNGVIYYTCKNKLKGYYIDEKKQEIILENIPNEGEFKECKLMIKDNYIYLSIGAATNSGIVDKEGEKFDLSPKKLILSGRNYNENKTGAFVEYNITTKKGQEIKDSPIGNASVIRIDLTSKKNELYCFGVRNIEGIDYNSEGKVYGVVGGIEDKGFRPIHDDVDYIYELKGDENWYGWPDYSGGDPVNSPRFFKENKTTVNFVLEKHPSSKLDSPFYQHNDIVALTALCIDRDGVLGEKDSIFTFDKKRGVLINILKEGAVKNTIKLYKNANVKDMKIYKGELYLLDKNNGYLFKVFNHSKNNSNNMIAMFFLLLSTIFMSITLVIKLFNEEKIS
ncbi:hypothetical protein [Clostridium tarantellae]|uniref:Glucose/Sorbosone dehydrogenase domain-containing protein n=1 Tax=Clostridium tarantellae TaxID=39493 RepID=A0A6I1MK61_9CLOT|nr:hypothetical protein [Clostridium tarantellae]MPQ42828.1 hypothetical protein [Clostridium tarantellae]